MSNMIQFIEEMYQPDDSYLYNYTLPFLIITTLVMIIAVLYVKAKMNESKKGWQVNKCVPKYMFISGFIDQSLGTTIASSTYNNFIECVQQYRKLI